MEKEFCVTLKLVAFHTWLSLRAKSCNEQFIPGHTPLTIFLTLTPEEDDQRQSGSHALKCARYFDTDGKRLIGQLQCRSKHKGVETFVNLIHMHMPKFEYVNIKHFRWTTSSLSASSVYLVWIINSEGKRKEQRKSGYLFILSILSYFKKLQ